MTIECGDPITDAFLPIAWAHKWNVILLTDEELGEDKDGMMETTARRLQELRMEE